MLLLLSLAPGPPPGPPPVRRPPATSGVMVTADASAYEGRDREDRVLWRTELVARAIGDLASGRLSYGRFLILDSEAGAADPDEVRYVAEERPRRITVLDTTTGVVRWTITSGRGEDEGGRSYFYALGAADGRVIVDLPALGVIHALDLADGALGWEARLPTGCRSLGRDTHMDGHTEAWDGSSRSEDWDIPRELVTEDEVTLLVHCEGGRTRLLRFDARTGAPRGEIAVAPAGHPRLRVERGVTVIRADDSITLVDPLGRVIFDRVSGRCGCDALVTPAAAFVVWGSDEHASLLTVIRRDSGRAVATRAYRNAWISGFDERRGLVFVFRSWPYPLHQEVGGFTTFDVLEASTGRLVTVVSEPLTEDDAVRAIAEGGGWGARGGVPATAWPDPCALLPPEALTARTGIAYRAIPVPGPVELGLTTPVSCRFLPLRAGRLEVTVTVNWVYASEAAADETMSGLLQRSTPGGPDLADRAYWVDDLEDAVALRAGNTIVLVEALGERDTALRAAELVAARLEGGVDDA
ncbi:PQQ-binding-like beta-propeller repeat protein [Microtetraspora glauca]|uniref:PQQ-binding-like beta-propeller repeat protein n=1 Tax=Microtetraspora glauca TaxID=1996 RepID=A0ABV3GSG7_MICGL